MTFNSDLFDSFQSFLNLKIPVDPENSIEIPPPTQKKFQIPIENSPQDLKRQLIEAKEWLRCYNGGVPLDMKRNVTVCGNTVVKMMGITPNNKNCQTYEMEDPVCICPYDTYGSLCQVVNTLRCKLQSLTFPPEECSLENQQEKKVSKYYSYNIDGDKPCHSVKRDTTVDVKYRLECAYDRPDLLYEGVKKLDGQIYPDVQPGEYNFVYGLDSGDIKITHFRTMKMKMSLVNWKIRSKSPTFDITLEPEHITGEKDIVIQVDFNQKKMKNVLIGSRYYYELHIHGYGVDVDGTRGVIEDADFVEPKGRPKPKNRHRVTWFCGILVLVVLLIFVCRQKLVRYQKDVVNKLDKRRGYMYLEEDASASTITDEAHNNHLKTH